MVLIAFALVKVLQNGRRELVVGVVFIDFVAVVVVVVVVVLTIVGQSLY